MSFSKADAGSYKASINSGSNKNPGPQSLILPLEIWKTLKTKDLGLGFFFPHDEPQLIN